MSVDQSLKSFVQGVMNLAETQKKKIEEASQYDLRASKQPGMKNLTLNVLGAAGKELGSEVQEIKEDLSTDITDK